MWRIFLIFGIVFVFWLLAGPLGLFYVERYCDWSVTTTGAYGDWHGFVNSLFAGLAFAGVIAAVWIQQQELELARHEYRKAAEAQRDSAEALSKQVKVPILLDLQRQFSRPDFVQANTRLARWVRGYKSADSDFVDYFVKFKQGKIDDRLVRQAEGILLDGAEAGYFATDVNNRRVLEAMEADGFRQTVLATYRLLSKLYRAGIVDLELLRVVVTEEMAAVALSILAPLGIAVGEVPDQEVFRLICSLYPEERLAEVGFELWMITAGLPDRMAHVYKKFST